VQIPGDEPEQEIESLWMERLWGRGF